jgi:ATP-dependent HslUV protease ATP-binding subunit HslU
MERLLEKLSFEASDIKDTKVIIDAEYVDKYLNEFAENEDLSRYIL